MRSELPNEHAQNTEDGMSGEKRHGSPANGVRTKLIACNMIRDEVLVAMERAAVDYDIEWIDEGLHTHPEKLRAGVQDALNRSDACKRVLLAFGHCGGMADGLYTGDFELVMPDVDDCISLMLYPHREGKEAGVYYLTGGWLRSETNCWCDYDRTAARHGEAKAKRIVDRMMDSYHTMAFLENGVCHDAFSYNKGRELADWLNLKYCRQPGSTDWITQLIKGPWDKRFLRVGAHETLKMPYG
jgi:hypothetical protein